MSYNVITESVYAGDVQVDNLSSSGSVSGTSAYFSGSGNLMKLANPALSGNVVLRYLGPNDVILGYVGYGANGAQHEDLYLTNQTVTGKTILSNGSLGRLTVDNLGNISFNSKTLSAGVWQGTQIGTAYGGTNSTIAPTAGGIVYGTGTAYATTSAGPAKGLVVSNAAGAPTIEAFDLAVHAPDSSYKKIVQLATTSDVSASFLFNNTLYGYPQTEATTGTTISSSTTLTVSGTNKIKLGATITGNINIPPTTSVVTILTGTTVQMSQAATANGSNVSTTFTNTIAALPAIDSVTPVVGDRILVKDNYYFGGLPNTSAPAYNGIYKVTSVGSSSSYWILTRDIDADTISKIDGQLVAVSKGTINGGRRFQSYVKSTDTLNTTPMYWNKLADINASGFVNNPGESIGLDLNSEDKTITFTGQNLTTLNMNYFGGKTIKSINASGNTYTNASTVYISGTPTASTNVTITNPYSLFVKQGKTYFGGDIINNGSNYDTQSTTFNLLNTGATTLNFAGAATTLNIGASTGNTVIKNNIAISGTITTPQWIRMEGASPTIHNKTSANRLFLSGSINGDSVSGGAIALREQLSVTNGNGIEFFSGGSERSRFTSGGNFLIGSTTDGGQRLQITGSSSFTGTISGSDNINLKKSSADLGIILENNGLGVSRASFVDLISSQVLSGSQGIRIMQTATTTASTSPTYTAFRGFIGSLTNYVDYIRFGDGSADSHATSADIIFNVNKSGTSSYGNIRFVNGNFSVENGTTSLVGNTSILGTLNTTGAITSSNVNNVAASSATIGFVGYNGTSPQFGMFDGGAVAPTGVNRLNYNGYFYPTYVNLVGSPDSAAAASHYFIETGTDGFVRPKTLANVKTEIVTNAAIVAASATYAPVALVAGNLAYSTGANSIAGITSVATGQVLLSNGVGVAPVYGDVSLTTAVSGTLPVTAGGTGVTTSTGTGNVVLSISPTFTGTVTAAAISASGNITALAFFSTSSRRYKENIVNIENALETVDKLQGVTYNLKSTGQKQIGLIAEDVNEILPEVVYKNANGQPDSISYDNVIGILVEAIKELKSEIEILKGNK